ncbi:MAG TPA: SDR family NAD(P)-dependent oxidoreductase [Blastocatellia bacterium]|nr:SDR family NAD(P)-dependent oxidoreductase [Blastocatellia bacterium]HMV86166.1 SDR family NAD(P)-dependent oxidoreductase [Blastocatellia bacterium]HMZ17004.1 SDR family NAD(P)-dependent oxidoreductase [Blastocatellia bacterium]HNG29965.1 SDR family NAD(P)-dependent oxidoreductase [Blastocatellia bacterium]
MNWKTRLIVGAVKHYVLPGMARRVTRKSGKSALVAGGAGVLLAARALAKRMKEESLCGKTVLITGGSRELGLMPARDFLREGARAALCARDAEELERARQDLEQRGGF